MSISRNLSILAEGASTVGVLNETNGGTGTTTGYYGFKNRIINGLFQIAQRATSATITAASTIALGYSTVDRWYAYCTGANVTAAQVAGAGNNKNLFQITGAASVTAVGIGQRIEAVNCYDLASQTTTLSVSIANSLLTSVTWTAYYANTTDTFGTLASPTRTSIATGTFTVTSTLTKYSTNISMPANAINGVEIVFTVGAQTSGTWQLGNVQLELGATATSFDYRPYGTELALCQRYYQTIGYGIASLPVIVAVYSGSTSSTGQIKHIVSMRASPTFSVTGSLEGLDNSLGPVTVTATLSTSSVDVTRLSFSHTFLTSNAAREYRTVNTTSSVNLSAEL